MLALQFSLLLSQFSISNNKTAQSPGTLIRTAAYEYNISCWTYCKEKSFQKKSLFVCMTNYLSPELHWYTKSWAAEYNLWHIGLCWFALCQIFAHTDPSPSLSTALVHHILSPVLQFAVYDWSFKPLINISPLRDLSKWLISIFRRILGNTPLPDYLMPFPPSPLQEQVPSTNSRNWKNQKRWEKSFQLSRSECHIHLIWRNIDNNSSNNSKCQSHRN